VVAIINLIGLISFFFFCYFGFSYFFDSIVITGYFNKILTHRFLANLTNLNKQKLNKVKTDLIKLVKENIQKTIPSIIKLWQFKCEFS